jgi:two-component system chemotaxis response regulator CheY
LSDHDPKRHGATDKRRRSCLIVDDSTTIRRFVAGLFHDLGFDVAEAQNGLHAVEHCCGNTPDLILLDWNMPVMDGITCLRELRAMAFEVRPAIVMCTTESQIGKIQEALASGADEYIMKPFDRSVLLDKLVQLDLA